MINAFNKKWGNGDCYPYFHFLYLFCRNQGKLSLHKINKKEGNK